jgi:ATP-dependent phosphofructokinase / diphosphate-dependent phosphofructokinase
VKKNIGILTAGGDCPGLNAAIRGIAKTAMVEHNMNVYGFTDGFRGMIDETYFQFDENNLSGILTLGGTILGTSREKPFKKTEELFDDEYSKPDKIVDTYNKLNLDCLVCIGGNGTIKTAYQFHQKGINIIALPKTIDNDVWGTDTTFGFDSAVSIATEAIDRLHTTGNSHRRVMVIEVMGHSAGWIALHSGIASGGDVILLPELEYDEDVMCQYILDRHNKGKQYSIVVVGEGISTPKKKNAGRYIAKLIMEKTGIETRETVLGYIQRGGTPTSFDRILATEYGHFAADLIAKNKFGQLVVQKGNIISSIPLEETAGKLKLVEPNNKLVKMAKDLGVCFG